MFKSLKRSAKGANVPHAKATAGLATVKMPTPEGTYLLFADFSEYCEKTGKTLDEVEQAMWDVGVSVQDGREFHGPCHIRINVALPFALIQEACERMEKYVFND